MKEITAEEAIKRINKQREYVRTYQKSLVAYTFKYSKDKDIEVINKLNSKTNKSDYIRNLILKDIEKGK